MFDGETPTLMRLVTSSPSSHLDWIGFQPRAFQPGVSQSLIGLTSLINPI